MKRPMVAFLTWNTFREEDEAIEIANDTTYGLAAMVFSRNERARVERGVAGDRRHGLGKLLLRP